MRTTRPFTMDTFRRGHEERDADLLLDLYAEDAEITVIDQTNPPSHPMVLRGLAEIETYLRDLCSRDMDHVIADEMMAGDHASAMVACRYHDGLRVFAADAFQLGDDGLIHRETIVQAWDPA
jgi:ketosteroid isomerase-like protein